MVALKSNNKKTQIVFQEANRCADKPAGLRSSISEQYTDFVTPSEILHILSNDCREVSFPH